jgi:DNA-binding NarL/FixJ family response regulator
MKTEDNMDSKIRVLVIDGSFIHTQLLCEALRRDGDLEVFSCDSVQAARNAALECIFDVLLISANLDEHSYRGLEVLRELRAVRPQMRAITLLDSSKPEAVLNAFRAGAKGVFSRNDSLDQLCKCIRCVHNGQIWANSREASLALEALSCAPALHVLDPNGLNRLSKREMETVQCVAEGLTNREIAERFRVSRHTIKNSLFRIFDKLGVSNRLELVSMTHFRDSNPHLVVSNVLTNGIPQDDGTLEECQQAAEQGSVVAQVLLAQLHSTKSTLSDHLMAYKWYLNASAQLSEAAKKLRKSMTAEQLSQIEEMEGNWLKRSRKLPAGPPTRSGSLYSAS